MKCHFTQRQGSTLVVTILTIAVCSLIIGALFQMLLPKYRGVHQAANWQEALQGAEAGMNYAQLTLDQFALSGADPATYDWAGSGWSFTDPTYSLNGERTLATTSLPALGGQNNIAVTTLAVDVYTRNSTAPNTPWFRIRSTGRADLPGRLVSDDKRDGQLRRMKLGAKKAGVADPHVTRTVEALAKPRPRFARALTVGLGVSLGNSSNWRVDSFDSSDTHKSDLGSSAGGVYPANASERQSNGGVATLNPAAAGGAYVSLIDGNGATIAGDVQTVGGDNPNTTTHENVSGSGGMDQSRIFDKFDEEIAAVAKPSWSSSTSPPAGNTNFLTGSATAPKRYIIHGNLGAFTVTAPPAGTTGYVEIQVNGKLDIGNGKIVIPPNVYATTFVDGSVDFGGGDVNSDASSSQVAAHFKVYGVSTFLSPTYSASGNAVQTLSFYGPNYAASFNGNVTTNGSIVAKSFSISGGGNGGLHYDEALGNSGDVAGWTIASYFEDVRAD